MTAACPLESSVSPEASLAYLASALTVTSGASPYSQNANYKQMVDLVLDVVFETDNDGNWTFLNSAWETITGFTVAECMGMSFLEFVHVDDRAGNIEKFGPLIRREKELCRHVVRYLRKDNTFRWIEVHARLKRDAEDQTIGTCGILRDITAQKEAEIALERAQERYALAAEGTKDGLWDWDLRTGEIYYSPRWKELLGYGAGEPLATIGAWFDSIHTADRAKVTAQLETHFSGQTDSFECEYRAHHQDGGWRWMLSRGIARRDLAGHAIRIAGSMTDVTESKVRDGLTGLSNRVHFLHRLEFAVEHLKNRPEYQYSVLALHIEGFKTVNDSLGYIAGNQVLAEVARRLQAMRQPCGRGFLVARLGADEFGVLVDEQKTESCPLHVADAASDALMAPIHVVGRDVQLAVCVGIVHGVPEFQTAEDVLCAADTALWEARREEIRRVKIYEPEMRQRVLKRLDSENAVRRAIDLKHFEVHYQPQVQLSRRVITGVEALARWRHPERGILPPSEFIAIAEETGLILPLGYLVLTEACQQAGAWRRQYPEANDWALSVNLSPKQLADPDLPRRVQDELQRNGLPGSCLNLELTESCLVEDRRSLVRVMDGLRSLGVGLHMDDFGTGYSSLSYLQRFPFTALKLDRSFVSQVNVQNSREIVATIVKLARTLHLDAVAEGIETAEQADVLSDLDCEYGQGYFFSRPLDRHAVAGLLFEEVGTRLH